MRGLDRNREVAAASDIDDLRRREPRQEASANQVRQQPSVSSEMMPRQVP
jgi:hypothetical protein